MNFSLANLVYSNYLTGIFITINPEDVGKKYNRMSIKMMSFLKGPDIFPSIPENDEKEGGIKQYFYKFVFFN